MAQTTYVKLETIGEIQNWNDHINTNWDKIDEFLGKNIAFGADPQAIDGDFIGQVLVELGAGGTFLRYWICTVVGSPGVWVTPAQLSNVWESAQIGKAIETTPGAGTYILLLNQSNFFRITCNNAIVLQPANIPISPNCMSFQVELIQGNGTGSIDFSGPNHWAFPYGGEKPTLSPNAGDIDIMFCTVRGDGIIHAGYQPLSVVV